MIISEAVKQNPAEVLTTAGFPNPHKRYDRAIPSPVGLPVALGPSQDGEKGPVQKKRAPRERAQRSEAELGGAGNKPSDALEGEQVLSEQVLRQKAKIAELDAAAKASAVEQTEESEYETEEEEDDPQQAMERLLESVVPCAASYPVSIVQSAERQRVQSNGDKWTSVKGLRIMVKPANADDTVLLVANCMLTPETDKEESHWAIHRGGAKVSPKFATHSRQRNWSHCVCMPYVDQLEKRAEHEYQVVTNAGGCNGRFEVSPEKQRRHFFAVNFPSHQVAWLEDDERQPVEPGPWRDVKDMCEVVTTLPGERVLAICTLRYAAAWGSEMNRGRFTLARDDFGLDGLHDRGLQSVRAMNPGLHRVALMATVDAPPPGPHIYRVRTAVTAGCETGVSNVLQGDRQLALIRLPAAIVVGPRPVLEPVCVDEGRWTEIPGLEATIALKRARDKVMIIYHTDCNPQQHFYKAHFTLFRRCEGGVGAPKNLGFSDELGTDMVTSDYAASNEYPVGILCDTPGALGTYNYYVCARVDNMGTSTDNPPVTVGYSGTISLVLLSAG